MEWEKMSHKERAEQTIRDIKLRQERKLIGIREADSFMFSNINKSKKNRDKIRNRQYRGKW